MKTSNFPNNNNKRYQRSINTNNKEEAQIGKPANLNKDQNTETIKNLYGNNKVQLSRGGKGLLDMCTITTASGEPFLIASDTGCTNPLVTKSIIDSGRLLSHTRQTKSTIQVAGGKRILGTNHTCLLPIKRTNSGTTHKEPIATEVRKIITDIPKINIEAMTKAVYAEYEARCKENKTSPRCQFSSLPTTYGGTISMLLSQNAFRPRIFFTSKDGTTLAAHPFETNSAQVIVGGIIPDTYFIKKGVLKQKTRKPFTSKTTQDDETGTSHLPNTALITTNSAETKTTTTNNSQEIQTTKRIKTYEKGRTIQTKQVTKTTY